MDLTDGGAAAEADLDLLSDAATADDFERLLASLGGLGTAEQQAEGAAAFAAEQQRTAHMSARELLIDALDGADPWAACMEEDYVPAPLQPQQVLMTAVGNSGQWALTPEQLLAMSRE